MNYTRKERDLVLAAVLKHLNTVYGRRWHRPYPCRDEGSQLRMYDNVLRVEIPNLGTRGLTLAEIEGLRAFVGSDDVRVSGCGEDFGDSIGHEAWLELAFVDPRKRGPVKGGPK